MRHLDNKHRDYPVPSACHATERFGKYKKEDGKGILKAGLTGDETLKKISDIWKRCTCSSDEVPDEKMYSSILMHLRGIAFFPADVERFSVLMSGFQDEGMFVDKAGIFLSALMNTGINDGFVIQSAHLDRINLLGFRNRKKFTINGDASLIGCWMRAGSITLNGDCIGVSSDSGLESVGARMSGGIITINGDSREGVGYKLRGGTIKVQGDCLGNVGYEMENGIIIIEGNAKGEVGYGMEDGIIHLNGDYSRISDEISGGRIFHKGRLIAGDE